MNPFSKRARFESSDISAGALNNPTRRESFLIAPNEILSESELFSNPIQSASSVFNRYIVVLSRNRGESHGGLESCYDAALDVFKFPLDAAAGCIAVSAAAKGFGDLGNVVLAF